MILALDIGNTNIKCGLFDGMEMLSYFRVSTDRRKSSDEYGIVLLRSSTRDIRRATFGES